MKKFPLAPLVRLRAHAVDARSETLAECIGQVQQARQSRARAEHSERAHEQTRRGVETSEQELLAAGAVNAQDLQLLAEYQRGAERAAVNLRNQSAAVQQRLERAQHAHAEALRALAEAHAEQQLIELQQARFVAAERAQAEAAAEEEALEVWQSRRLQG